LPTGQGFPLVGIVLGVDQAGAGADLQPACAAGPHQSVDPGPAEPLDDGLHHLDEDRRGLVVARAERRRHGVVPRRELRDVVGVGRVPGDGDEFLVVDSLDPPAPRDVRDGVATAQEFPGGSLSDSSARTE
jgi:hypothetical protein